MKYFRLEKLILKSHPIFRNNEFIFFDNDEIDEPQYFSILIGTNGTGKSELLKIILQLFKALTQYLLFSKSFNPNFFFEMTFYNNGKKFTYKNIFDIEDTYSLIMNNKKKYPSPLLIEGKKNEIKPNSEEIILPKKIIAQSIMLTDKFIVPRNEKEKNEFPIYRYLGLRNRPQQASTRSYVRRTIELIIEQINSDVFRDGLNSMTSFLGISDDIVVTYNTAYTTRFFKGNLTKGELDQYFDTIYKKYQEEEKLAPFKVSAYHSIRNEGRADDLVYFINELVKKNLLQHIPRSSVKKLNFKVTDKKEHKNLKENYKFLDDLRRIGLLRAPEVKLSKKGIGIQNVSSGEFHFFSSMVGLLASIEDNSIVLIDEPEISLHPNWQMKYLSFVRKLFSNERYQGVQFIIATHSHFLISDLKGKSAFITGIKKEKNIETFQFNKTDTYGWSAEDILYSIFKVKSTRNQYVEQDLINLLDIINNKKYKIDELKNILFRLKELELSSNDPTNIVIEKGVEYLKTLDD